MIGQLAGKAKTFLSGLGGKASGAMTGERGLSMLASSAQFAMAHPTLTGAAVGAAGGFAGSMGDPGGAFAGAAFGAALGRGGISRYRAGKLSSKGTIGGLRKSMQYSSRNLGNKIRKALPDVAEAVGPNRMKPIAKPLFTAPPSFGAVSPGATPGMISAGADKRMGGKMLGALTIGTGLTFGAGAMSGIGWNLATEPIKAAGRTARGQLGAHYGNAFSGMGNGTITSY